MATDPLLPDFLQETTPATSGDSQPASPAAAAIRSTLPVFRTGTVVFNRFVLERELGRGGMGVVWLAHDRSLDIDVALKFLPGMVCLDPEAEGELLREIRRGLHVTHPGAVRVFDLHEDRVETVAAISMEYVDGPSLRDLKLQQPDHCFNPEELLPWVEQICDTLAYFHEEAHIVHRDIKPHNLMLKNHSRVKIADFGLSATLSESHSRVSGAPTSGSPAYMSPQQARGILSAPTDDIYSLGVTLYELLTSRPPFFRGGLEAVLHQHATEMAPKMAERRRELNTNNRHEIPARWEETVAACLAKEPGQRPQSARELARLLSLRTSSLATPLNLPATISADGRTPAGEIKLSLANPDHETAGRRSEHSEAKREIHTFPWWTLATAVVLGAVLFFCWMVNANKRFALEVRRWAAQFHLTSFPSPTEKQRLPAAGSPAPGNVADAKTIQGNPPAPATSAHVATGCFGFPQQSAKVLTERPEIRVSAWNNGRWLCLQTILYNVEAPSRVRLDATRELYDYSSLTLDSAGTGRTYTLDISPEARGLSYRVASGTNAAGGVRTKSNGRGSIRFVSLADGKRARVDSFLIPLAEAELSPGERVRVNYSGLSPKLSDSITSGAGGLQARDYTISEANAPLRENVLVQATPVNYRRPVDGASLSRFAWKGEHVAFLTQRRDLDPQVMTELVDAADGFHEFMFEMTGHNPAKGWEYEGASAVVELDANTPVASRPDGEGGVEWTPAQFARAYEALRGKGEIDGALLSQISLNFWYYGPQLSLGRNLDSEPFRVGYATFSRCVAAPHLGFVLSGETPGLRSAAQADEILRLYLTDVSHTFENTVAAGAAPRNALNLGASDLVAAFCVRFCAKHGGRACVDRLWKEAGKLPKSKGPQTSIDNFILAACAAADRNILPLVNVRWRWPVSMAARREIQSRWGIAAASAADDGLTN